MEVPLVAALAVTVALAGLALGLGLALRRTTGRLAAAEEKVAELEELREALGRGERRRDRLLPSGRGAVRAVWETAALVRERGVGGALRSSIEDLAGWAQVERPDLVRMASRDGTVTLFFSDIEGSTALNDELGDRTWVRLVAWHDRLVRARVVENDGHVVKTQGDGFMVAFADAVQAVRCAVQVQRDLEAAGRRPGRTPVRVRIGVHRGEAVHRDGDLFGRNVALAARVASLADGGELKATDPVLTQLDPARVALLGTEEVELKGLAGVHVVHTLGWSRRARASAGEPGDD